ncbi:MAG: hypothetical protein HYU67_11920 [Flavobacteriia bacterium]|nr:hypothetical protein [Flavobacteriia bacterium]
METLQIKKCLDSVRFYLEKNDFKGYDPYDGLESPLFKIFPFKNWRNFRFLFQQFIKRFPINLRSLLGIKKTLNPVTLALSLEGYLNLQEANKEENYQDKIQFIVKKLINLSSSNFSGYCWAYPFDWQARYAYIPSKQPNIVATGIVSNALFQYWQKTKDKSVEEVLISVKNFVLKDLNQSFEKDGLCFSYSPFDQQKVLNASMKATRILAQIYYISKDSTLLPIIQNSVHYVLSKQEANGAFPYSNNRSKVDSYHSAYVIDCLTHINKIITDKKLEKAIELAYGYYKSTFFNENGEAYFYNNIKFPLDCTSVGQALKTLTEHNDSQLAKKVAENTVKQMQKKDGSFRFRKYAFYTQNTSFPRWSESWMFSGLSYLLKFEFKKTLK